MCLAKRPYIAPLSLSEMVGVRLFLLIALLLCGTGVWAQGGMRPQDIPPQFRPPHPASKMTERFFLIDAKRASENMNGEDALPRSREFKRIDSTYYVGWMFEGVYKYDHAADYLGFKNAIYPLSHALDLLEHDYAKALATRTSDPYVYYPVFRLQLDYTQIAYYLMSCYSNTDQPDKAFSVIRRSLHWNFQNQAYMDAYNYMAWTVHRNRFFKHDKYAFLRNSIDENEALANKYLDSAMRIAIRNKPLNDVFQPAVWENDRMAVYHYKNILYSYALNVDSAEHYFNLMRQAGRLPHNNYANFKVTCGDFRTAEEEYKIAATQDNDRRLQEWAYYSSILDIYKSKTREGIQLARDMMKAAGPTPGYGWYNIALARCLMYDGQISESQRYADRATDFKEVHIGTTLGQSQYEFSIQLLKLINKENERAMLQFEHSNWWYNPSVLLDMAGKMSEKYMQEFLIINQFSQNPERDKVIYKLFSTESTVSWDEIWYLVHDFSTQYFVNRFEKEAATDKRRYIRKYFELMAAKLQMKLGHYSEAKSRLDKISGTPDIDEDYEKLFTARLYQAEAECAKELKSHSDYDAWMYKLYQLYPQLIPYCGLKMNMALNIVGAADKKVVDRLKDCNINWVTGLSTPAPVATISFNGQGSKKTITFSVQDRSGKYIVQKQSIDNKQPEETAIALAYRLFDVGTPIPDKDKDK